jgi:hypothetical protein
MSKKTRKHARTLGEQRTLPIQAPDRRDPQTQAGSQNDANVARAKRWGEEHGS